MCEKSVGILGECCCCICSFFFQRERYFWMVLVDWSIDWLFFVEISLRLELKIFEKKNDGYIGWEKKQVLRIMNRLNLNDTNNHKSNMLLLLFVGDDMLFWKQREIWCSRFCFFERRKIKYTYAILLSWFSYWLGILGQHHMYFFWWLMAFHYLLVLVFLFKLIIKCLISIMSGN